MLHLLDVAHNAVEAGARTVKISIKEDLAADRVCCLVADNGPGMSPEMVERVSTEFATTKRKKDGWRGFGLALLRGTADLCEGRFTITSRLGIGTLVAVDLPHRHWDRPPLGNVADSLHALIGGCSGVDFCVTHRVADRSYRLDTRLIRRELGEAYTTRAVREWIRDQLRQGEAALAQAQEG